MSRRLLSLHRHAPGIQAREALDAVLVAGVFEQSVSLLFREAGVRQLLETELTDDFAEAIRSLSDYGIQAIFVCEQSLLASELSAKDLLVPVKLVSPVEQAGLLSEQDMVLCD